MPERSLLHELLTDRLLWTVVLALLLLRMLLVWFLA